MSNVGLRIYSLSYTRELLCTKIGEAFPILSLAIKKLDQEVMEDYNRRHNAFVCHVRDEKNLGACRSAHLLGQGVELNLHLQSMESEANGPEIRITPDPGHWIKIHSPKYVCNLAKQIIEGNEKSWEDAALFVQKVVTKFEQDAFFLVTMDTVNAGALRLHFQSEDNVDLRVRLKSPDPRPEKVETP